MQITMDMLLYALQKINPDTTICPGEETVFIKELHLTAQPPVLLISDTLYLWEGKLFTGTPAASVGLSVSDADLVIRCWNEILNWQNRICENLLEPSFFDTVMPLGRQYLRHNYCLVDQEMQLLYASNHQTSDINARTFLFEEHKALDDEMIQALLAERDFHLVISRKEPFYYHFLYTDSYSYCRNIFHDQKYFSRLVMYLNDDESRLDKGEEDFFLYFSEKVQQLCRLAIESGYRHAADLLHHACHALLFGEPIEPTTVSYAMQQAGWQPEHNFLVMKMIFLENPQWKVAPETSLPYLVSQIEQTWPQSCAFVSDQHAICILNLSKSAEFAGTVREELQIFYHQLAPFIREAVCHAGLSAVFHDVTQFPDAAREAAYALNKGQLRQPQYWYFLFDDFHLDYLLDTITQQVPALALQDPALAILEKYDHTHEDALLDTLCTYLDCGMNMTKAADQLYIHRTTFCRRMDRIRKLTNLDLENTETILRLWILLKTERKHT